MSALRSRPAIVAVVLLPLLFGITQNLALVLALRDLRLSFYAGMLIILFGSLLLVRRRDALHAIMSDALRAAADRRDFSTAALALGVLLVLVYLLITLYGSLIIEWDARSIWFFHAKILFFDGGFEQSSWTLPTIVFSHPDYPKTIPILAAQIAALNGYWNEYDPLTSLAILLVVQGLLLAYVLKTPAELIVFAGLAAVVLTPHPFVNGYMDAHIATMSALAAMCLMQWRKETGATDFCLGVLTLGLVAAMKNEGLVLGLVVFGVCSLANPELRSALLRFNMPRKSFVVLIVAALPTLLWIYLKLQWGLTSDLSESGHWERLLSRMNLQSLTMIHDALKVLPAFLVAVVLSLASRLTNRSVCAADALVACAALYCAVLVGVFLTTPSDLKWHLSTSANRVVLPISMMLICALVLYLRAWTSSPDRVSKPNMTTLV